MSKLKGESQVGSQRRIRGGLKALDVRRALRFLVIVAFRSKALVFHRNCDLVGKF